MMWPDARSAGEALELHFAVAPSDRERVTRKLTARDLEAGLADLAPAIVLFPSGEALAVAADGVVITPEGRRRVAHRVGRCAAREGAHPTGQAPGCFGRQGASHLQNSTLPVEIFQSSLGMGPEGPKSPENLVAPPA